MSAVDTLHDAEAALAAAQKALEAAEAAALASAAADVPPHAAAPVVAPEVVAIGSVDIPLGPTAVG